MKKKMMALALVLALTFPQIVSANTDIAESSADEQQTTVVESETESEAVSEERDMYTESEVFLESDTVLPESETTEEAVFDEQSAEIFADNDIAVMANNEVSSATSINVNQTYTDNLVEYGDINWYKFTISGTGYISLDFKHDYIESSSTYWKAFLYNSEQTELTEYGYEGNRATYTGGNIGIPAGTYYLKITQSSHSDKNYNLEINYTTSSVWETEFNDEYTSADVINVNQTYYGSLMQYGDTDWYKFKTTEAGYISLDFKHDYIESSSTYWKAFLYNSEQTELTEYGYEGNRATYTGGNIGIPAGTYYLKITQSSHSDKNYNLEINYTTSSVWETEFNDEYTSADAINVNKNYYGSLMQYGDTDWYKFKMTEAGYISLNFKHDYIESSSTYWKAFLYNSEQTELTEYSYDGNQATYTGGNIGIPAGTYYLKITQSSHSDKNYNFKINFKASKVWETELNNDYTTADKVSYGKTYYGSLMSWDDQDWYKMEIPSSGTKMIYFKHDKVDSSSTYWNVRLYDSDLSEIWNYYSSGNETSYSEKVKLSSGTYYLKVEHSSHSDKTYNFQISGVVSKPQKVTLKKTSNDSQGNIKVNWEKVKDAKGYRIYKKDKNGDYKKVADVASDKTSYIDKSGSIGSKYTYTVRAYKKSGNQYILGDYDKNGVNGQKIPAKVILATIKNNSKGQVNLTWEKVSGIDGYRVYRKASGEGWKKLKDVTATSITDTSAKIGVTYSYTVRAYKKINGNLVQGSYDSKGFSGKRVPPTVQLVSAKYQKDKGVVVNWKKTDDCSGYVIYRKDTKSGWTRLAKVSGKDNVKYTDKVRSNINTYKYTVRAYQTVNAKEILGGYDKSGVSVTK